MPEFVKVKYWRHRVVLVNGQRAGFTNKTLTLGQGRKRFELSLPMNYRPTEQIKLVKGTSRSRPLVIEFHHQSQGER